MEPPVTTLMISFAQAGDGVWEYLPLIAKIFNLVLFVGLLLYFLRRPILEGFRGRREGIRTELLRAQEERNAALAQLQEVEERLARLNGEVEQIRAQAQREAAEEGQRIERATEEEIRKLREQARRETQNASKAARACLREYAAEQSIRVAEEIIRRDMRPEDDERLVKGYVEELGGIRR